MSYTVLKQNRDHGASWLDSLLLPCMRHARTHRTLCSQLSVCSSDVVLLGLAATASAVGMLMKARLFYRHFLKRRHPQPASPIAGTQKMRSLRTIVHHAVLAQATANLQERTEEHQADMVTTYAYRRLPGPAERGRRSFAVGAVPQRLRHSSRMDRMGSIRLLWPSDTCWADCAKTFRWER